MHKSHHALTLEASTQLLQTWPGTGATARYAKAAKENSDPAQVQQMRRWVVQPDEIDDIYVPSAIVNAIIDKVSRATCFQHFAYGGSLGPLRGGKVTVDKLDGYAWDCDPFLCWYECLVVIVRNPGRVPETSRALAPAGEARLRRRERGPTSSTAPIPTCPPRSWKATPPARWCSATSIGTTRSTRPRST